MWLEFLIYGFVILRRFNNVTSVPVATAPLSCRLQQDLIISAKAMHFLWCETETSVYGRYQLLSTKALIIRRWCSSFYLFFSEEKKQSRISAGLK
jgi:hypothetical protein